MTDSSKKDRANPTLIFIIIIGLVVIVVAQRDKFKKYGTITIAQVIKSEGAAEGNNLHLAVLFRGERIEMIANAMCRRCDGKYFFVKILRNDPSQSVIFYDDKLVPECILRQPLPQEGWKEIPNCE